MLLNHFKKVQNYLFILWCILLPWSLAAMQILLGLLTFSVILQGVIERRIPVKYHHFYIFILLYLFAHALTLATVENFGTSLKAVVDNDWVLLTLPFIISMPLTTEVRKRGINLLLLSAVISGVYGIIQFFLGVDYIRNQGLGSLGQFYRAVGGYDSFFAFAGNQLFIFAYAFSFFLVEEKYSSCRKNIYLSASIIVLLSIIATMTRSAWLGLILILLLATLLVHRKYFVIIIGLLICIAAILFLAFPDLQSRFISIFDANQNEGRLNLWHTSWNIFSDHKLLGIGHANFDQYFEIYKVPGFYDAKGHAHNDYLNLLVLNGIVGLIMWMGMWISWYYYSVKMFYSGDLVKSDKIILLSGILGVSGILIGSIFQCYYTDLENNIFWWFVAMMNLQIVIQNKIQQN